MLATIPLHRRQASQTLSSYANPVSSALAQERKKINKIECIGTVEDKKLDLNTKPLLNTVSSFECEEKREVIFFLIFFNFSLIMLIVYHLLVLHWYWNNHLLKSLIILKQ